MQKSKKTKCYPYVAETNEKDNFFKLMKIGEIYICMEKLDSRYLCLLTYK